MAQFVPKNKMHWRDDAGASPIKRASTSSGRQLDKPAPNIFLKTP